LTTEEFRADEFRADEFTLDDGKAAVGRVRPKPTRRPWRALLRIGAVGFA
jgi:hypothetical protein